MNNDLECAPDVAAPDALNISGEDTNQFYPMFLTIDKAVEYTGLSRTTIDKMVNAFRDPLPYVVFPGNSRKFIIRDEIQDYVVSKYRGENNDQRGH